MRLERQRLCGVHASRFSHESAPGRLSTRPRALTNSADARLYISALICFVPLHRPAIDELLRALPPKAQRQTVLFSATFPANIAALAAYALRPGYTTVDTIGETAAQTADKVLPWLFALPLNKMPCCTVQACCTLAM